MWGDQARHPARQALEAAAKACQAPEIRLHDLRHTPATLLLTRGVHQKVLLEMLGHSKISLMLDTYSHVSPGLGKDRFARTLASVTGRRLAYDELTEKQAFHWGNYRLDTYRS